MRVTPPSPLELTRNNSSRNSRATSKRGNSIAMDPSREWSKTLRRSVSFRCRISIDKLTRQQPAFVLAAVLQQQLYGRGNHVFDGLTYRGHLVRGEIGRVSCRERVCQYG